MLKPVYVVASSRSGQSGWYIADENGVPLSQSGAFRDRAACKAAIASRYNAG